MNMNVLDLLFLIFMPLSGLAIIAFGLNELKKEQFIKMQGVETDAQVIAFKSMGTSAAPIVEFQTAQGLFKAKSRYSATSFLYPFGKGDTIRIKYNERNPKQFLIVGSHISTILWSAVVFSGVMCIIMGMLLYFIVFK